MNYLFYYAYIEKSQVRLRDGKLRKDMLYVIAIICIEKDNGFSTAV